MKLQNSCIAFTITICLLFLVITFKLSVTLIPQVQEKTPVSTFLFFALREEKNRLGLRVFTPGMDLASIFWGAAHRPRACCVISRYSQNGLICWAYTQPGGTTQKKSQIHAHYVHI